MPTRIISREEARELGLKTYFTGKPCRQGHIDERYVSNNICRTCAQTRQGRERDSRPRKRASSLLRNEALRLGLKTYFSGLPCKYGHIGERYTSSSSCVPCRQGYIAGRVKALGAGEGKTYFTGKPCKHGHIAARYASTLHCVECVKEKGRKWEGLERNKARRKLYPKNKDKAAVVKRRFRERHRDRISLLRKAQRDANLVVYRAQEARKRAAKRQATPAWADLDAIKAFYARADALAKETGIPHEVDHVIPLNHESVCGLHVPENLQVLTKSGNRSKHNKFDL
jgi:hypothetical protein